MNSVICWTITDELSSIELNLNFNILFCKTELMKPTDEPYLIEMNMSIHQWLNIDDVLEICCVLSKIFWRFVVVSRRLSDFSNRFWRFTGTIYAVRESVAVFCCCTTACWWKQDFDYTVNESRILIARAVQWEQNLITLSMGAGFWLNCCTGNNLSMRAGTCQWDQDFNYTLWNHWLDCGLNQVEGNYRSYKLVAREL